MGPVGSFSLEFRFSLVTLSRSIEVGSADGSAGDWLDEEGLSLAGWALLHTVSHAPGSGMRATR